MNPNPVSLVESKVDSQGVTVTLRWNRFAGGRFEAYRVERFGLDVLDFEEIGRIEDISDTLFIDEDPALEVSRYRVVVEAAGEAFPSERSDKVRLSTPAAVLQSVEFDSRERTATLTWSRYSGEADFLAYEIRRRRSGESAPEPLETIDDIADTSFVDADINAGLYVYSVAVMISTSGAELNGDAMEAIFPSHLRVVFDSREAAASLSWSPSVSGFGRYEIWRESMDASEEVRTIYSTFVVDDTSFVDSALKGDTEYTYTVNTVARNGAEVESVSVAGSIHSFQREWSVAKQMTGAIAIDSDDRLHLSTADPDLIYRFGSSGESVGERGFCGDGHRRWA